MTDQASPVAALLREYAMKRDMSAGQVARAIDPDDDGTLEAEVRRLMTDGPRAEEIQDLIWGGNPSCS